MIKYKDRSIMRKHIKNIPIKWSFRKWYRCTPKTGYLYEFYIYTGRKETTEFGLGKSVVLQLTEKLNGSFCSIFLDNIFASPWLLRKLTDNSLYGIGVVRQNPKLLPKIKKPTKEKSQAGKKQKKQQKPKELIHGSSFTSEKSFNC